jgi:hypothetical protein
MNKFKCEVENCKNKVSHAEYFYERVRYWCEEHTPWSGHYEFHDVSCARLVAEGRKQMNEKQPELTQKELLIEAAGVQQGIFNVILSSKLATDEHAHIVIELMLTASASMALHKGFGRKMFLDACRQIFMNSERQVEEMKKAMPNMACAAEPKIILTGESK